MVGPPGGAVETPLPLSLIKNDIDILESVRGHISHPQECTALTNCSAKENGVHCRNQAPQGEVGNPEKLSEAVTPLVSLSMGAWLPCPPPLSLSLPVSLSSCFLLTSPNPSSSHLYAGPLE